MRYTNVAVKGSRQMILQMMTQGTLEAKAKTRYRSTIRDHTDETAGFEVPGRGAINREINGDFGALVASGAIGGGVGVG